jgi:hypothetical protein
MYWRHVRTHGLSINISKKNLEIWRIWGEKNFPKKSFVEVAAASFFFYVSPSGKKFPQKKSSWEEVFPVRKPSMNQSIHPSIHTTSIYATWCACGQKEYM